MQPVPGQAVYYCHILCKLNPDIDGKFAPFLDEKLKSDSDVEMEGSADNRGGGGNKSSKDLLAVVATLATATTSISKVLESKHVQKAQDAVNEEDKEEGRHWEEYLNLADRFLEMKKQPEKVPLLRNFAIRIRKLEKLCGVSIEDSITKDVPGVPTEVATTVATEGTTTSDVTSNK
jgi:hypothetical protein